jgi:uroporphyrinogen decarboxylase
MNPPSAWSLRLARLGPPAVVGRAIAEKWVLPRDRDMSRRERAVRAIELRGPDRVPHQKRDFWFLFHLPPRSWQPAGDYYPYVHPGIVATGGWKWEKRKDVKWLQEKRIAIDEFGTVWKTSGATSLGETVSSPLQDGWHLLDRYRLPDMKDWERFETTAFWAGRLKGDRYLLSVDGNSIWERFRYLRGFENAMMDLVLHPEEVHQLLGRLTDMTIDIVDNYHKAGADGFMLVDDWGTQTQSFISPRHFEEFFLPCYRRIADRCHELGMHCGMHSCGDLKKLTPLLIAAGLDFLELDSPDMCGVDWLAENAAGKICLWCSVDIQNVYPTNDPAIIARYIKDLIWKLGGHNGGLVAWPYAEPWVIEVGWQTARLERKLFEQYGGYPLDLKELKS